MKPSTLVSEEKQNISILILDKNGKIGKSLAEKLKDEALVFIVTKRQMPALDNIIEIPYKTVPHIPDNNYSYIFVIDEDVSETKKVLAQIIEKAGRDKAVFVFATGVENIDSPVVKEVLEEKGAKIIFYGDVFDSDNSFNSITNTLIFGAKKTGRIDLPSDGTGLIYPIFFDEVVSSILQASISIDSRQNVFLAMYKHPMTLMSFAHTLQKTEPFLKVDFTAEKKFERKISIPKDAKYLIENDLVAERLKNFKSKDFTEREEKETQSKPISNKPFVFLFISIIVLFFIPLVLTGISFLLGTAFLGITKTSVLNGDLGRAYITGSVAKNFYFFSQKTELVTNTELGIIGKEEALASFSVSIEEGIDLSNGVIYFLNGVSSMKDIFLGTAKNPSKSLDEAQSSLKNALVLFQKEKTQKSSLSLFMKVDPVITIISNTIDIWPSLFGFDRKKTYLILFQNNEELRPSGGFIGSYGLLTLDKGRVSDFSINDVYEADGNLKGHVEPPFAIRRFLPSAHWFLRDSNFDVDFEKSASTSAFFLDLETSKKVDAVIGVDFSLLKQIVSATGPINIPDYKETVTADNIFSLAEAKSQNNFFPGSTQKKDFLSALYKSILSKVSEGKNISYASLIETAVNSIFEKHVLFAFNDKNIQDSFTVNDWSSSLWDNRQNFDVSDFLGLSEANLGVNKANYFIERSLTQDINIKDDGIILSNATILYKNKSTNTDLLGGDYKNYLRLILPQGSEISQITIDGEKVETTPAITDSAVYEAKNFVASKKLEIENYQEGNKSIFGFLINVPKGKEKSVSIDYSINKKISLDAPSFSYDLKFFKQPGVDSIPYNFSLSVPSSYRAVNLSQGINIGEKITFSKKITRDFDLSLEFAKR